MKPVEIANDRKILPVRRLSPRIMVFRPFVDQLPKLDVAGSTPVARSLFHPPITDLRRRLPTLPGGLWAGAGCAPSEALYGVHGKRKCKRSPK